MSKLILPNNLDSKRNFTEGNTALQIDYVDVIGKMLYNMAPIEGKIKLLNAYKKALFIIDMNNGFVNFGKMANPKYNDLVSNQMQLIEKFREEDELVNFILECHKLNSIEFLSYPEHCIEGTEEAKLIPQFQGEVAKDNTLTFYKNSINGMFNRRLQNVFIQLINLKEIVFAGVCEDLCVMDFVRSLARFLDEINRPVKLFVVKNSIDTFDKLDHNRDEWKDIAYKVMSQAGVEVVENFEHLVEREKTLGLHKIA